MSTASLGAIFSFLSSCTWALGSSNYSALSRDFSPFRVNLSRALFALPLFVLAVFATTGGWAAGIEAYSHLGWRHLGWFVASMLSSYAFGDVLFLWSTRSLGVPGALALASTYPIVTAIVGLVFFGEPLRPLQWLGLLVAVGGTMAVILTLPPPAETAGELGPTKTLAETRRDQSWLSRKPVGIALAFLASLCWCVNSFSVAKGGADIHPAVGNTVRMALAIVLSSAIGLAVSRTVVVPLPKPTLRKYAWVFVIESFAGSYFFMYGLSRSSLVLGATLASLAPVIAVPVAVLMRLEKFSWKRSLAVATVVGGLALLV